MPTYDRLSATYPVWIFRRGEAAEDDSALWFNAFGKPCLKRRQRIEIAWILDRLRREIRAGRLPPGSAAVGWPGVSGARPSNGVNTSDAAAMKPWFQRTYCIVLSCDELAAPAGVSAVAVNDRADCGSFSNGARR
jgi:hypothetical protein